MEVMVFDVAMPATEKKTTWLMMESVTPPWRWMLMKTCLVCLFCIFNNSVNIKPSHPSPQTEWRGVISQAPLRIISADWSNYAFEMWRVPFLNFFSLFFLLLRLLLRCFVLFFVVMSERKVRNGVYPLIWPASPDKRDAHSRWHHFGVCTRRAATPFISCELKFTTYPFDRRSKHL